MASPKLERWCWLMNSGRFLRAGRGGGTTAQALWPCGSRIVLACADGTFGHGSGGRPGDGPGRQSRSGRFAVLAGPGWTGSERRAAATGRPPAPSPDEHVREGSSPRTTWMQTGRRTVTLTGQRGSICPGRRACRSLQVHRGSGGPSASSRTYVAQKWKLSYATAVHLIKVRDVVGLYMSLRP